MRKLIADLAKKSVADLEKEIHNAQQDVRKYLIEARVKPQKDTNLAAKKRRYIAQVLTVLQERKLFEANQPKKVTKS